MVIQTNFGLQPDAGKLIERWHDDGTAPECGQVFVFGSNLAGRHGKGAALAAQRSFGAIRGIGSGYQGWGPAHCYAIPTKDDRLRTLQFEEIARHVRDFVLFANAHPRLEFFVTRVGCVLAGHTDADIAPLFAEAPLDRCSFARQWRPYLAGC